MGDMLYAPLGSGKPIRIQGAVVSDEEREKVIAFIKEGSEARYSDEIMAQIEKAAEDKSSGNGSGGGNGKEMPEETLANNFDELLPQAVDVIFETKQASVSMLQRRLKLGYSPCGTARGPNGGNRRRRAFRRLQTQTDSFYTGSVAGNAVRERNGPAGKTDGRTAFPAG
jgi:hypothetical protein